MISAVNDALTKAWEMTRSWPPEWRRLLASQLLQSLNEAPTSHATTQTPAELIGAWSVLQPPSDADVDRILDEERQRKSG